MPIGASGNSEVDIVTAFNTTGTEQGFTARCIPRKVGQILTTTNLGVSGVYTSSWFDTSQTGGLLLFAKVFTDKVSAIDGFKIQTTDDTTDSNLTKTANQISVMNSTLVLLTSSIRSRFWRIQYTNGTVAQTSFKLTVTESVAYVPSITSLGETKTSDLWQARVESGNAYVTTTNFINFTTSNETDYLLLKNPSGSNKILKIKKFDLGVDFNNAPPSVYRIYRDPTITANGTALTISNIRKSGSVSIASAFRSPTISARGTLLVAQSFLGGTPTNEHNLGFIIEAGENILITMDNGATNVDTCVTTYWSED